MANNTLRGHQGNRYEESTKPSVYLCRVARDEPAIPPSRPSYGFILSAHRETATRPRSLTKNADVPTHLVNDPAPVPTPSPSHGSYHWTFDRLLAAGLVPLTVAPFAAGSLNPVLDATLCGAILVHSHTGFQNILIDYIPNGRFPKARKFSMWALNAATVLVGIGLYEFETNDVGLTEAVKRVWKA